MGRKESDVFILEQEECQLKEPPFRQCCCNCKHHIPDYSHPETDGKSVSNQRGWICLFGGDKDGAFSGWPEHSVGCELYNRRK